MDIRVTLEKPKHKYNRRVRIFINRLDGSLLVVFSIQNLFATHRTDAFLVGTALTVMRTWLVYRTFTNSASGELIFSIWIKPCFLRSQSFVFVQLPSTTFCGVPGPVLPCVWSDNPAEFHFTLFTHHPSTGRPVPSTRKAGAAAKIHQQHSWEDFLFRLRQFASVLSPPAPAYPGWKKSREG